MSNTNDLLEKNGVSKESRIVRVRDLPIYYNAKEDDIYQYAPEQNTWLKTQVSQIRKSVQQTWSDNKELRVRIARMIETGGAHAKSTADYIRDDHTFLPKVGVVTLAGLGGLLLGHRGGPVRKTFYSSVAVAVALSACYPKQSAAILDQAYVRIKNEANFAYEKATGKSVPTAPSTATLNKKLSDVKDKIIHTTKSTSTTSTPVVPDYGQGSLADQHLYTTRGGTTEYERSKK
ncbi:unnamed protein product [Didymodactylos carnosus]|uniref:MICOS complex subunit n=1 Tax=Didymodactylos carnosus TaxID=1234261 RepID=A0A815H111_9BILA|nr:unnamed protein product [Didymodactylos carnosus]CAF1345359.1 unnamed protein product [Didymodactylos carnosus]CAF3812398.1 unnamed protein product [Didymodactylos carnosus]CAF4210446.1 unnamed protein product [Didymodactylos carnosus]